MTSAAAARPSMPVRLADYAPGATFGPRTCRDFEFVWLLRGSARWRVAPAHAAEALVHDLRPGLLTLVHAGATDTYAWDEQRSSTHAYVHFELPDPPARRGDPPDWPLVRSLADQPLLAALCDHLVELGGSDEPVARAQSDRLVGVLLELFLTGPMPAHAANMPETITRMIDGVVGVWSRDGLRLVSAAELAAFVHLSPGHVFRLFRRTYGCGPAHALDLVRLSRAAVALQRSNATVAEVARQTGFANPFHFSRRFSAAYGVPPGAYRRLPSTDPLAPVRRAGLLPVAYSLAGGGDTRPQPSPTR